MTDFRINVVVDPNNANQGIKSVDTGLNNLDRTANRVRSTIAAALSFVGAGQAIRTLANFEQQMSTVRAVTGATASQFRVLAEETKRLGSTTRFSASQAAEGATFLARAGFTTDQILGSLNDTLLLAQAGALGLGEAADIASNVLTGFGISADEAGRAVDVLAFAANNANTDVSQLGNAMKFVAPVASGLGVTLEETAAAIGALSDAGLQGSMAGTGLRRVLTELESPTGKTRDILRSLGLTTDEVRISQVGLTSALEALADAGIDTGIALELFGDRGGPAFEVLRSAIPRVKELTGDLQNAGGTAREVAEIMDDNLNGAMLSVVSAAEGLILAIGESGTSGALTSGFRTLADAVRFLTENVDTLIKVGNTLAIIYGVNLAKVALPAAIAGVKALTVAIVANPIGAVFTVIVALTAALISFSDRIRFSSGSLVTLRDVGFATFELLGQAVENLLNFFRDNFGFIGTFAGEIFGDVELSVEGVVRFAARAIDNFIRIWVAGFNAVVAVYENFPNALRNIFINAFNGIIQIVETGVNKITEAINTITDFARIASIPLIGLSRIENDYENSGRALGNAITSGFRAAFDLSFAEDILDGILVRSREIAAEREKAKIDSAPSAPAVLAGGTGGTTGTPLPGQTDFDKVLADIEQERQLLKLSSDQREIQNRIIKVEDELKRSLTNTEREQLEVAFEQIQALTLQAQLYEQMRGPLNEYNNSLEAANILLEQGKINVQEYDKILRSTQLGSQIAALESELMSGSISGQLSMERQAFQERLDLLATAQENEITILGGYNNVKEQIEKQHQENMMRIRSEAATEFLGNFSNLTNNLQAIASNRLDVERQNLQSLVSTEQEKIDALVKSGAAEEVIAAEKKAADTRIKLQEQVARRAFEQQKQTRIASALIDGLAAAVASYSAGASVGGPITGAAFAAVSAAATTSLINKIRSQEFKGGGSVNAPSAGGSAGSGSSVPQQPVENQRGPSSLTLNVSGTDLNQDDFIKILRDAFNGDEVVIERGTAQAQELAS